MTPKKPQTPVFKLDINKAAELAKRLGVVLKTTAPIKEFPTHITAMFKSEYSTVTDRNAQIVVSILNSCIYHERAVFVMTRKNVRQLFRKDPNWSIENHNGVSNDKWGAILSIGFKGGFFKQIFRGVDKQPSVYEITHPGLLELLGVDVEAQRLEALEFVGKGREVKPVAQKETPVQQKMKELNIPDDKTPEVVPVDLKFKHSDFGLDFLETLTQVNKNEPYHFLKLQSLRYGFASLPEKEKLVGLISNYFFNDKYLDLKNKALKQVNKAYKECFLDVPEGQVSEKKLEIYFTALEEMENVQLNSLNKAEQKIFDIEKPKIIEASIIKNNGGVIPDDLKAIKEEVRKLTEAKQIIASVESDILKNEGEDLFQKMFERGIAGVIGTDRDDS